jgi:glycosyltransferase involved in cell wall biosynthesis
MFIQPKSETAMTEYILITPVKNEENTIEEMIKSIISQTKKPALFIIIDGGSTDETRNIAEEYLKDFSWIVLTHQRTFSDIGGHINFSLAMHEAYILADKHCQMNKIEYDFVGKIDGDAIVSENFFENLISKFKDDKTLGAASGISFTEGKRDMFPKDELPDKRLYRKDALEQIGGFPDSKYSPDTVILAKMRMAGWGVQAFDSSVITNLRSDGGMSRGDWNTGVIFGKARYYLGYSVPLLLLGCGYNLAGGRIRKTLGLIQGYFGSWIAKDPKIADIKVRNYFHYTRIKEVMHL